jgi:hypothetical protein
MELPGARGALSKSENTYGGASLRSSSRVFHFVTSVPFLYLGNIMGKSRAFVFTINWWQEEDLNAVKALQCEYCIAGAEIGEKGTPHLQGYVYFKNPRSFTSVKKILARAHIEAAKGTPKQNYEYCAKQSIVYETGEIPRQGNRTDLQGIVKLIDDGATMEDIVRESTSIQSVRAAEIVMKYLEKPRDFKPTVLWFWGGAGKGKTREAINILGGVGNYFRVLNGKWFDGYDKHDNVLWDDFDDEEIPWKRLLVLLDRYDVRVETKGGTRQFLAKKIIITSTQHPIEYYRMINEDMAQLTRRIDEIRHFD